MRAAGHSRGVGLRSERPHRAVLVAEGLEPLEDLLRVVQDGSRRVELERTVRHDLAVVPALVRGPGRDDHVVGELLAEAGIRQDRLAVGVTGRARVIGAGERQRRLGGHGRTPAGRVRRMEPRILAPAGRRGALRSHTRRKRWVRASPEKSLGQVEVTVDEVSPVGDRWGAGADVTNTSARTSRENSPIAGSVAHPGQVGGDDGPCNEREFTMTTLQQRRGTAAVHWHHPYVHQRGEAWVWECRCGAAGRGASSGDWHRTFVAARLHAHHATR